MPGSVDAGEPPLAVVGLVGVADDGVVAGVVPAEAQAAVTIPATQLTSHTSWVAVALEMNDWVRGILEMYLSVARVSLSEKYGPYMIWPAL